MYPYPNFDGTQVCAQTDPELWFPEGAPLSANRVAIRICNECDFQKECLEYALHYKTEGIWGGTTNQQRREIRKKRGIIPLPLISILSVSPEAVKARERRAKKKAEQEE